jgi:AraC-like DNA-binding protein
MSGAFVVDTDDVGEAEATLSENFGPMRIRVPCDTSATRTRIWRIAVGSLVLDEAEYGYDMSYTMDPPDKIMLCRVRSGSIEEILPQQDSHVFGPGRVGAFGAIEGVPFAGSVSNPLYDMFVLDRALFDDAATGRPARLTSTRPVSNSANDMVADAIDYVRHRVLTNPHAGRDPLVAGALTRYLAATVLSAFPNDIRERKTPLHRCDDTEVLVRRAVAFIDDNAHTDITAVDIAAAAHVTPEALQMMFVRHRKLTPSEYLRKVRLHHVRRELVAADPETTSVAAIAQRWGFGHAARFALAYRLTYGESPRSTLRGESAPTDG